MTTCTVEILREAYEHSSANARSIANAIPGVTNHKFNEEAVREWLDDNKSNHIANRLGKGVRPWQIVNLTEKLDPKQPWIGVEYETGFSKKPEYDSVINYLWMNHPFTSIDHEGCGRYPCEITFPPVNLDSFMADDYKMNQLIGMMEKSAPKAPHRDAVGIHINISTPAYRSIKDYRVASSIAGSIGCLLQHMEKKDKTEFFGRQPYGYAFAQSGGKQKWIEFKLFDSVGEVNKWNKYKPVAVKLAELIEFFSLNQHIKFHAYVDEDNKGYYSVYDPGARDAGALSVISSTNLADFLAGKITADKIEVTYKKMKRDFGFWM